MNVEQKPFMRTHGDGKPYFSWKIRGTNRPTQLYKCLISHIAQHFIAHDRDATYIPSSQEEFDKRVQQAREEADTMQPKVNGLSAEVYTIYNDEEAQKLARTLT